ncbi:type IV pilus assembly protein PilE [Steroidobacter denitrificans]|uniref:Type IV pilus assembly protein PilE n=1 Tax=Steroidobacter denitrificans TaxID=465721 RepID=A0A127FCF6_STEDE|nr:type IV pilin protein [Steroidobacter denitrificans]AMN47269.1 type IV pilus assembly protein PilE [Steroidobacter denitrificans]
MNRISGITLIELLIVIVVIGILAAIAYPSYQQQVRRSNRAEGKIALEQTAQALEKCFTRYLSYNSADCAAANQFDDGGSFDTPNGRYRVTATLESTTFTLQAPPLASQLDDARCMSFVLNETGQRTIAGGSGTATECW